MSDEGETYEVQVLTCRSPHELWVLPVKEDDSGVSDVQQIGLYSAVGQEMAVDVTGGHFVLKKSPRFTPAALIAMNRFFTGKQILFTLKMVIPNGGTILDDNVYRYGEISARDGDGNITHLSQYLKEEQLAVPCLASFMSYVESGAVPPKLSTFDKEKIIKSIIDAPVDIARSIWTEQVQKQTQLVTQLMQLESEVKSEKSKQEAEKIIAKKESDFKLSAGHDYEYKGVPRPKRAALPALQASRRSNAALALLEKAQMKKREREAGHTGSTRSNAQEATMKTKEMSQLKDIVTTANHTYEEKENKDTNSKYNSIVRGRDSFDPWNYNEENLNQLEDFAIDRSYFNPYVGEDSFLDAKESKEEKGVDGLSSFPKVVNADANKKSLLHLNADKLDSSESSMSSVSGKSKYKLLIKKYNPTTNSSEHDKEASIDDLKNELARYEKELTRIEKNEATMKESPMPVRESASEVKKSEKCSGKAVLKSLMMKNNKQPEIPTEGINNFDAPIVEGVLHTNKELVKEHKSPYESPDKYCVNPFDYNSKFTANIVTPKLMVHSKNKVRIKPVTDLKNVYFTDEIHQTLIDMGINVPTSLQTVSWPTILRGHSFFMVNAQNSGKTMGYLPALCRHVMDSKETDNSGPIAIIVCDTTKSVVDVAKNCYKLLKGKKTVLTFYAGIDVEEFVQSLQNGCDILVCTPFFLCKLFNLGKFSLDLDYLSIVVLDGCSRIDEFYYNEFKMFFAQINKMLKTRVNQNHKIQYIATTSQWCRLMQQLVKKLPNPVVCIGFFHECAVYSAACTSVIYDMDKSKIESLLKFYKETDPSKRSVVVCNTKEEIELVKNALKADKYTVISGNTDLSIQELYNLNQSWFDCNLKCIAPVLVCCDDNLRYLNVTNSHYLVHYSLPSTFSSFCKRFAVLIENYKSIFQDEETGVKVLILVDSENTQQLPKVLNFMKRCTDTVPEQLDQICERILIEKDKMKAQSHYPVCDNILAFGECHDFWYCEKRHALFPACDTPVDWMPKSGTVTLNILHYHTPIHYSCELTSYTEGGKVIEIPSMITRLAMKMNIYFSNEKNKKLHGIPKPGDICAVSTSRNYFERCRIIRILDYYDNGKPRRVLTRLIDEEKEYVATDIELLHLPDQIKAIVTHIVQVRLAKVKPKDKDVTFSELAKKCLIRKLKQENIYLRAQIALVVGNVIVVDDLEACQDIRTTNDTVLWCNVKDFLCEKYAEPNLEHLPNLYKLCKTYGIPIPGEEGMVAPQKEMKKCFKPQWAHMEGDAMNLVFFSVAENPGKFFIRLVKFDDCLENLNKDIQKYVENNKSEEPFQFKQGDFVLAKFPDDLQHHRARIDYMPAATSSESARCFFVDHGDWRSVGCGDLKVLPESLIVVLPFQAIECRLIGLQPVGAEWSDWSTNFLYKLCFLNGQDLKELYVKYFTKEPAEHTDGFKYGIAMIDTNTEDDIIINDLMLNANVASSNDAEQKFLENISCDIKMVTKDNDSDSSIVDEEWEADAKLYDKNVTFEAKSDAKLEAKSDAKLEAKTDSEKCKADTFESEVEDDCGFDVVNIQLMFKELLNQSRQKSTPKNEKTPRLAVEDAKGLLSSDDKSESTADRSSSCSGYEVLAHPEMTELDSDDLSSPGQSVCELKATKMKAQDVGPVATSENRKLVPTVEVTQNDVSSENQAQDQTTSMTLDSLETGKRKPQLRWRQTKTDITVKIEIADIKEYQLDIKPRSLSFEAQAHDTDYSFFIKFYGAVVPEKCTHSSKGLYVLVKLVKLLKMEWVALTEDCEMKRWIVYDQESLAADLNEEEDNEMEVLKEEFVQYVKEKRENDIHALEDEYLDEWDHL